MAGIEVLATLEANGILADTDWSLHHIAKENKVSSDGFNSFGQRYRYSFLDSPALDNILHEYC